MSGLASYPRTIKEALAEEVEHEVRPCLSNPIEQDHRGIKQRYYPPLGFGAFNSVKHFSQAHDEVRNCLRPRRKMTEIVSLLDRREHFLERVEEFQLLFQAA